jgi:hypothetical protein
MLMSMTTDGTIEVILSRQEQDLWQTNLRDAHHELQQQALREAHACGLEGDVHIVFQNGAHVCTMRLMQSWTYHVEQDS